MGVLLSYDICWWWFIWGMTDFKRKMRVQAPNFFLSLSLYKPHAVLPYPSDWTPHPQHSIWSWIYWHTHQRRTQYFPVKTTTPPGIKAHLDFPDPEDVLHPMLMQESDPLCCTGALPGVFFIQSCLSLGGKFKKEQCYWETKRGPVPCLKLESKGRDPSRPRPLVIGVWLRSMTWWRRSFLQ